MKADDRLPSSIQTDALVRTDSGPRSAVFEEFNERQIYARERIACLLASNYFCAASGAEGSQSAATSSSTANVTPP